MIISRNKHFFTPKVQWMMALLFFLVWIIFLKQLLFPDQSREPMVNPYIFPAIFTTLFLVVRFSKDAFTIDDQTYMLSNYVGLFGLRLFQEQRKLPHQIIRVAVIKRQKNWKRYLGLVIPFTTKLIVYEVFLIDRRGKPLRIFSLKESEAEPYANILRQLYGLEDGASHGI